MKKTDTNTPTADTERLQKDVVLEINKINDHAKQQKLQSDINTFDNKLRSIHRNRNNTSLVAAEHRQWVFVSQL